MCFAIFWEKQQLMSFFIQDLHLNFHSFLGFQHGSGRSVKAIMLLLSLVIGWNVLVSNSIIVISKVNHTWIIFPQSQRSLPTKPIFERVLAKAFYQYILNLMSKKKLGSFNDLIKVYFQPSYVCHNVNIFWSASFLKFPWHF